MRRPVDSPFSPGSDTIPSVWAGRAAQLSDWEDVLRPRRLAGIAERGRTVLGEAGLGKSALVRRIADGARSKGDWVTDQLRIPTGTDPLKRLAAALLDLARGAGLPTARDRRIKALLERVETVAVSGVSLSLRGQDGPEPYTALTELLLEVGREALRRKDTMVLIHLDEVQNITDERVLSQLLTALGDALTHEEEVSVPGGLTVAMALPIAVYLTGLPEFQDRANAREGATFARRFQTSVLAALEPEDLKAALSPYALRGWEFAGAGEERRVLLAADALQEIVDLSHGEPFLFQLAGHRAWLAGSGSTITREEVRRGWLSAEGEAENHVQRILDRLPEREREFIEAMAALPPADRTLTAIANAAGFDKASAAGPTSRRLDTVRGLIRRGTPYSFRHRAVQAYLEGDWPRLA